MFSVLKNEIKSFFYRMRFKLFIGKGTKISTRALLKNIDGGVIQIGNYCHIHDFAILATYGGDIIIGDHSTVNFYTVLYGHGGLKIGKGVRIGAQVVIVPSNHVFDDPGSFIYLQGDRNQGVTIEDDVWIGAGAKILDGVTIGQGAVVAAGAVVNVNVPRFAVVGGVPAKVIKYRKESKKA